MSPRSATLAWSAAAAVSGVVALAAAGRWAWAVFLDGPVLYGEGAVAHAAILARDGLEYTTFLPVRGVPVFVAANYPPLYFHLSALGDPFIAGRVASIVATLGVAATIAWRARRAGPLAASALALGWLAIGPVVIWGSAVKPDLVAMALTVAAVLALDGPRRRAVLAGLLLMLAIWAKPTAGLPALALVAWLVAVRDYRAVSRVALGGAFGIVATLPLQAGGAKAMFTHIVTWNALPWSAEQALLVGFLSVLTFGASLGAALLLRAPRGPVLAYAAGALAIAALGGREGGTINFLLDLSAATALSLATVAERLRPWPAYAVAAAAQVLLGLWVLNPFGWLPGRAVTTGAWGNPDRIALVRALPAGPALVEDSGLLVANGREPAIDDLFLWARLAEWGAIDRRPLVEAVRGGAFVAIVAEDDLEHLDQAPAYERQRWIPDLLREVLARYELDRTDAGLHVYRPRSR